MSANTEQSPVEPQGDLFRPGPLKDAVHEFKIEFILGVLKTTGGIQKTAAEILEIQPTYLSRLLSQLRSSHTGQVARKDPHLSESTPSEADKYASHQSHRF